jgi:hypothetical protein
MDHGIITMVVAIVAIVFGARIWRTYLVTRARNQRSPQDEALFGAMQQQIDKLSDRVAVLEKLATDDDRKLAGEIERLRERPGAY